MAKQNIRFLNKYRFLNDETLATAAVHDPDILVELIEDANLRPSTRGDVLEHLAVGARAEYFDYIKSKTKAHEPHIRESAFIAMYEYYDTDPVVYDVKCYFGKALESESAPGVQAKIQSLLEEM